MAKRKEKDAEMADRIDAPATPPDELTAPAENERNVEEANEKSAEKPVLDEPGTVEELKGGAGALPHSLTAAAANARAAERASDMQAQLSADPSRPDKVWAGALRKVADQVGRDTYVPILMDKFGVQEPEDVPLGRAPDAFDELHKALDAQNVL